MARLPVSRKSIEYAVFGVAAFALSGALVRIFSSGDADLVTSGDQRFELILAAIYFSIIVVALRSLGKTFRVALYNPALIGLVCLVFLSAAWAEMPSLVIRRAIGVTGATLFGLIFASRLDFAEQLAVLRRVLRFTAALTVAAWALGLAIGSNLVSGESSQIGGYQIEIDPGAWRGIFNHKNGLGAAMALAILVEWHIPAHTRASKILKALWLSTDAAFLLLSNSVTSLIAVALTILLMVTIRTFRHQYRLIVPVLLLVTMFSGALIALNANSATGALGRSADLSGRADLWGWVVTMILNRPILGYGFSGFWKGASDLSDVVEARIGWSPEYSHNGYLEIMLSLGIAGLLLFLWFAGTGLKRSMAKAKKAESIQDLWPLAFLTFFLIHNLGECTILWQNSLEWGLCVAVVVGSDPRLMEVTDTAPCEDDPLPQPEPEYL